MKKVASTGNNMKLDRGSSILEVLIALAILTFGISAATMLSFASQSVEVDIDTSHEALFKAQGMLEEARAQSLEDFGQVNPILPSVDDIYTKQLLVLETQCRKDVTSNITWDVSPLRPLTIELNTILGDVAKALTLGGDCIIEPPEGDWDNPESYGISDPIHSGSQGTDVDVVKNLGRRLAIETTTKAGNQDTIWIIDTTDALSSFLVESYAIEDDPSDFNAVDATPDYAYVASASTTAQLAVIDISNPSNPTSVANRALPGVNPVGSDPGAISIFYQNSRVYIGTKRTAGPEFHIFDVTTPSSPTHLGSLELNHNVHDIVVDGSYAYIASSANECELIVIDVSNPGSMTNPCPTPPIPPNATVFNAPGNFDGTAIYVLSNKVYLGRDRSQSSHDFHIINSSNLTSMSSLGSIDLNINAGKEVVSIIVAGRLAFIATTDTTPANGGGPFMVFDINDPGNITLVSTCPLNYSESVTGMDFSDDLIFLSNESNDAFRILYPAPSCS